LKLEREFEPFENAESSEASEDNFVPIAQYKKLQKSFFESQVSSRHVVLLFTARK
jgi:hypothetical protein